MVSKQYIVDYYQRKDIAEKITDYAKYREVAGAFRTGAYGKRPNVIQYQADVVQMAKEGV